MKQITCHKKIKGKLFIIALLAFLCLSMKTAYAAATPAGTEIKNTAVVVFDAGAGSISLVSNETVIIVEDTTVVSVVKSSVVRDRSGGGHAVSGSTITYTLAVTVSGNGRALDVVITDPIPVNTTYSAGTLTLNSVSLSDGADADTGNVGGTPVTVTVSLGDMTSASALQTIMFDVTIN